jgi:F-type H+-transporting ATPase subunit gamma
MRRDLGSRIVDRIELRDVKQLGFSNAESIGDKVLGMFEAGEFDVCTIFFSEFQNVITQVPTARRVIPAAVEKDGAQLTAAGGGVYEYEPDPADILADLIPRNIKVQIFRALLENAASEQGARMTAMDNATRNAGEMIRKQTITYNRTRQAMITKELIEIISGAEAL